MSSIFNIEPKGKFINTERGWQNVQQPKSQEPQNVDADLAAKYRAIPPSERTESQETFLELADQKARAAEAAKNERRNAWYTFNPGFPFPEDQQ